MGFRDWMRLALGLEVKASTTTQAIVRGLPEAVWAPRDYVTFSREGYQQNPWVYACVTEIARGIAGIPWRLYRGTGGRDALREIEDHPILRLLRRPNPEQGYSAWAEQLVSFLLISGNGYIEAVGPDNGAPRELYALRPDRMRVLPDPALRVKGYRYEVTGYKIDLDTEHCLHMKLFNPTDDWYGMSPLEAAARAIDQDNELSRYEVRLLQNQAMPGMVLRSQDQLDDRQYDRLKQQIQQMYQGTDNVGRPMILDGGLEAQPLSFSPQDLVMDKSMLWSAQRICAAFGVPGELVGLLSATYQNRREARKALYTETILPLLDRIADDLNNWLVPQFGESLTLAYDADSIEALQEDREALFNQIKVASWLTVNEQRVMAGYDERPEGDVILEPGTLVPLDALTAPATAPVVPAPVTGQASAPVPEIKAAADLAKINEAMDARREYWAGIYEPKIRKALRTGLDEIAAQVEGGDLNPSYGSLGDLKPVLTSLYDKVGRDFAGIISKSYRPRKKAVGLRETKAVFENVRPMWDSWVESTVGAQVSLIDEETRVQLANLIKRGIEEGLTYAAIAYEIRNTYEIVSYINNEGVERVPAVMRGDTETHLQYRPRLIARTESGIASAKGAHMEAQSLNQDIQELGLELRKRWVSIVDSRSRPDHAKLHNKVLPLDEPWNVGGTMMMHPKDISGGAENICNCRCDEVYVEVPIDQEALAANRDLMARINAAD
jgi:HK97 family phage portal protein